MNRRKKSYSIAKSTVFSRATLLMRVLMALMLGAASFVLCIQGAGKDIKDIRAVNGVVAIPMGKVANGTACFYRFNNGRKGVVFFVVRGSDGVFHTAFDACEVCYLRSDKGYIQKGDYMICQGCMEQYAINMIDQVNGTGCRPKYLNHSEIDGKVIIRTADLNAGACYFP